MRSYLKSLVGKRTLNQLADINAETDFTANGINDLSDSDKQVAIQEFNEGLQKFVSESAGAYSLGELSSSGIYNIKNVATGEDVLTSKKSEDGNISYHIKNAAENASVLKALAESRPAQSWNVRTCSSIESARMVIAQMGVDKVTFDDTNPKISAYKEQLKSEYPDAKFSSEKAGEVSARRVLSQ